MKKLLFLFSILFSTFLVKAQTIPVTDSIQISLAGSNDPDGTISSYSLVQTSGTSTTIVGASTVNPLIIFTAAGTYNYKATVTDNNGGQSTATLLVTVDAANILPHAIIMINGQIVSSYEIKLR